MTTKSHSEAVVKFTKVGATIAVAMQKPFPELMELDINSDWHDGSTLPDSFLGGTAPRLQLHELTNISFPGLLQLLLSAAQSFHLLN